MTELGSSTDVMHSLGRYLGAFCGQNTFGRVQELLVAAMVEGSEARNFLEMACSLHQCSQRSRNVTEVL